MSPRPARAPIVMGRIDESFHQVAAAVVEEVLLRLGHEVEVVEGPHPQMYPRLATGELDLFADAWLPGGHELYWEQVRHQAVEVTALYEGARFYWAVPAEIPAELAGSLTDLARPEVVQRMSTLTIQGTTAGAGLTHRSENLLDAYGLRDLGWHQQIGDLHAIIDTVDRRMAAGDWFVTPLWQPQYLNEIHDLRPLADPLGAFPVPDRAALLANSRAWETLPERTRTTLSRISHPVAAIDEMDLAVNLRGSDPLTAARQWMDDHPQTVAAWFG